VDEQNGSIKTPRGKGKPALFSLSKRKMTRCMSQEEFADMCGLDQSYRGGVIIDVFSNLLVSDFAQVAECVPEMLGRVAQSSRIPNCHITPLSGN